VTLAACLLLLSATGAAATPRATLGAPFAPLAAGAAGVPHATLSARFAPDVPGQSTTIYYGFTVFEPAPLRSMELRLPAGMGFAKSSLGLEECDPSILSEHGPKGCPPNSIVGFGSAYAEVSAQETITEKAKVTVLLGPASEGHPTVLFFIEAIYPAAKELVLYSQLLPSSQPFGDALEIEVPLLQSWPGGPNIDITRLGSTIGPHGLHYYYAEHGHRIEFSPKGLNVPDRCPSGGYPVQARFHWWGVSGTGVATTRVPCGKKR
jgi:hypothetical protein